MTEKQQYALDTVIAALPEECREGYRQIAEHAISLGYKPTLKGSRKDYADFSNSKVKRTILKIIADPKVRCLEMKFYALPEYSPYFQKAIENRVKTWERLKYEYHCYGCGICNGTEGYKVELSDGKQGFLCGIGLLPLPPLGEDNIVEVKEAMTMQHEFFKCQAS